MLKNKLTYLLCIVVVLFFHYIFIFYKIDINLNIFKGESIKKNEEKISFLIREEEIKKPMSESLKSLDVKKINKNQKIEQKKSNVFHSDESRGGSALMMSVDLAGDDLTYEPPDSFEIVYDYKFNDGANENEQQSALTWWTDLENYSIDWKITSHSNTIAFQSVGVIDGNLLVPYYFYDSTSLNSSICFQKEDVRKSEKQCSTQIAYVYGVQDKLSVLLQVVGVIANKEGLSLQERMLALTVQESTVLETWEVSFQGAGKFQTVDGIVDVQKIKLQSKSQSADQMEIFIAPHMGGIPVRISGMRIGGRIADFVFHSKKRL
jgi:Protein of unknown function (DUF3108)